MHIRCQMCTTLTIVIKSIYCNLFSMKPKKHEAFRSNGLSFERKSDFYGNENICVFLFVHIGYEMYVS